MINKLVLFKTPHHARGFEMIIGEVYNGLLMGVIKGLLRDLMRVFKDNKLFKVIGKVYYTRQ